MSHENNPFTKNHENDYQPAPVMPEVSPAIAETFKSIDERVPLIVGCGDDRGATPESIKYLTSQGFAAEPAFCRIFGGVYGIVNATLVATAIQHGPAAMRRELNGSLPGYAGRYAAQAGQHGFILATHSSVAAENNRAVLNFESGNMFGCARASVYGGINQLAQTDPTVINEAQAESASLFGDAHNFAQVANGYGLLAAELGAAPKDFAISRHDVAAAGLQAMVLDGDHTAVGHVDHVVNLTPNQISDPTLANSRGLHYYDSDLVQAARIIRLTKPKLELDARLVLDVLLLDEAATRAALATKEGGDPRLIKSYRHGDGHAALEYLKSL